VPVVPRLSEGNLILRQTLRFLDLAANPLNNEEA
jgi:hypothetical protein